MLKIVKTAIKLPKTNKKHGNGALNRLLYSSSAKNIYKKNSELRTSERVLLLNNFKEILFVLLYSYLS